MAKEYLITQQNFDLLLRWLDRDREAAGRKYEKIRDRLIRIFAGRGCFEAEELTDETINRVMVKLPQIIETYVGDPVFYFRGVAEKIHLEWLRKQKKIKTLEFTGSDNSDNENPLETEAEYECLESCLEILPQKHRELIVDYYLKEKITKIEHRKKIAETLGITINSLQVKTSRIRNNLKDCVQACLAEKAQ